MIEELPTPEQIESLLERLPRVKPSPLFRTKLSARLFWHALRTDLPGHLFAKTASFATAALSLVAVFIVSVYVFHNQSVTAGSSLYPLKLAVEDLELHFTASTPEKKAEGYLRRADRRAAELRALRDEVGQGYVNDVVLQKTLDDYVGSTTHALAAAKQSNDVSLKGKVSQVAAQQAAELKLLRQKIVPETTPGEPVKNPFEIVSEVISGTDSGTTSSESSPEEDPSDKPGLSRAQEILTTSGSEVAVLELNARTPSSGAMILDSATKALESIADQEVTE